MSNLASVISQLKQQQAVLKSQLQQVATALSVLNGGVNTGPRTGTMLAAGRARIAAAQRLRWTKATGRTGRKISAAPVKKRKLSSSAIAKIRAAQKKRWAKWKKQNAA